MYVNALFHMQILTIYKLSKPSLNSFRNFQFAKVFFEFSKNLNTQTSYSFTKWYKTIIKNFELLKFIYWKTMNLKWVNI